MDICNNHLFGLIIFFVVIAAGIVSVIRGENDDGEPTTADKYNKEWLN
jgi:hypothetical protein